MPMVLLHNHSPAPFESILPEKPQARRRLSDSHRHVALLSRPSLPTFSLHLSKNPQTVRQHGHTTLCQHDGLSFPLEEKPRSVRRQTKYHLTLWDHSFIESLPPCNMAFEARTKKRIENMKEKVVCMFRNTNDPLQKINLIDAIQRLGLDYHFGMEIQETLRQAYDDNDIDYNLYATALRFRLLREEGYHVSCDVFNKFKDKNERLKQSLRSDIEGLLSLYEASHYMIDEEDILKEALTFTSEHLNSICNHLDPSLARHIQHSLDLSLHKGMSSMKTMHYISFYEEYEAKNDILLELAKLDFNLVQSLHRREIKEVSKWHKDMDFLKKLPFGRNRVVESHAWALEMNFLPQFSFGRIALSKFLIMIALLDDTYDAYGTLDEVKLFTATVNRWDLSWLDQLPYYMKLSYLAVYNLFNEIAYMSFRDRGNNIIHYLKTTLAEYCEASMQQTKWFYDGLIPSFDEYLSVASITGAGPILTLVSTVGMGELVTTQDLEYIKHSKLLELITLNARLLNDMGTSKEEEERGDYIKSIQCCMKEKDISEEEARIQIKNLTMEIWKEINRELLKPTSLPKHIVKGMVNYVRLCETYYLNNTDGFGNSKCWTMDNINSLYFEPLPM